MSRADDDAAEALARGTAEPRLELPRTITGGQVLTLRAALKASDVALSRIKVKGLTRGFAAEVYDARSRIEAALAILSRDTPSAAGREVPSGD